MSESSTSGLRLTRVRELRNGTQSNSNNSNKRKGQDALERLITEASYECTVDPYRGLRFVFEDSENYKDSPWAVCRFCHCSEEEVQELTGASIVLEATGSQCPTLIAWTDKSIQKQSRKRKRKMSVVRELARRPIDDELKCRCDYNPFCLGSVGGIMDDFLSERVISNSSDSEVVVLEGRHMHGTNFDPISNPKICSSTTAEKLERVRKCLLVEEKRIRVYLKSVLQDLTSIVSIDQCIAALRQHHESLAFALSLGEESKISTASDMLRLAIPPGIENLGATCYLNTQLQCLGQNLVFVDGILSWNPGEAGDRMSSVISLFQQLLARMHAGPSSTLNTIEFSDALGLDRYEQQDPNEFSRLFFDKIHTFFQRSASSNANPDGCDLSTLLPHLFQGTMVYETSCLTCGAVSRMREEFMDLNLPIERPAFDRTLKEQKIDKIFDQISKGQRDTDVQCCLDTYCTKEKLEGDNQYYCSTCREKRDVERAVSFEKLPPVLNVQLCRYVFDRTTFTKKKLSDAVLLPTEIMVSSKSQDSSNNEKHRYLLCAVMRHRGKSAYQGHYVAEAMDWLSGLWFEFNDEKVTFLSDGPSCSYKPSEAESSESKKGQTQKKIKGSEDAYNMYYVLETFLAQNALDRFRKAMSLSLATPKQSLTLDRPFALEQTALERSEFYRGLARMCREDVRKARKLVKRQSDVMSQVMPLLTEHELQLSSDCIWIEISVLNELFSSKTCTTEFPKEGKYITVHKSFVCSHKVPGILPHMARRGKVLPKSVFNELRRIVNTTTDEVLSRDDFNMMVTIPSTNIICDDCSEDYRLRLRIKLERLTDLIVLHNALEKVDDNFSLEIGPTETDECEKFAYIVSRKFITAFRSKFDSLKKLAMSSDDAKSTEKEFVIESCEALTEGIDAFQLTAFDFCSDCNTAGLDLTVNDNITCQHGKCTTLNKRIIRYVPPDVWELLVKIFPKAIAHKRERRHWLDGDETVLSAFLCDECGARDSKKRCIFELAKGGLAALKSIEQLHDDQIVDRETKANGDLTCYRLVPKADIVSLDMMLSAFKEKDVDIAEPEAFVQSIGFEFKEDSLDPRFDVYRYTSLSKLTRSRVKFLVSLLQPMLCSQHHLPAWHAVFKSKDPSNRGALRERFVFLKENDYMQFMNYLLASVALLIPGEECNPELDFRQLLDEAKIVLQKHELDVFHPQLQAGPPLSDASVTKCVLTSKTCSLVFALPSKICDADDCNCDVIKQLGQDAEPSLLESNEPIPTSNGGAADDPIDILSDTEDAHPEKRYTIRVFQADASSSLDDLSIAICSYAGVRSKEAVESGLRRSSRRKSNRYPSGSILGENPIQLSLSYNIAALRLLLLERCPGFELNHSLTLFVVPPATDTETNNDGIDETKPVTEEIASVESIDLSLDMDSLPLCEAYDTHNISWLKGNAFIPGKCLLLVWRQCPDKYAGNVPQDQLLDHLISLSNAADKKSTSKQNRKSHVPEKGFSGTFLTSSPSKLIKEKNAALQDVSSQLVSIDKSASKQCSRSISGSLDDKHQDATSAIKTHNDSKSGKLDGLAVSTDMTAKVNASMTTEQCHLESSQQGCSEGHLGSSECHRGVKRPISGATKRPLHNADLTFQTMNQTLKRLENEHSEDDLDLFKGGLTPNSKRRRSKNASNSRELDAMVDRVSNALKQMVSEVDQNSCMLAAEWALSTTSVGKADVELVEADDSGILSLAMSRYFDITQA